MIFTFDERPSDSPFIDTIWRTQSEHAGTFLSRAVSHWEMVVTRHAGRITLSVRGPETKATLAHCPANAEFFGIKFRLGTFLPHLPASLLLDAETILPETTSQSFWFHGSAWQFPDYDNAETFIGRLVHDGLLMREPIVEAALQGHLEECSLRSVQRRFLRATGLTQSTIRQIERARAAASLLEQGVSILDTVDLVGYADQSHLTRSLKRLIGLTPTQLVGGSKPV